MSAMRCNAASARRECWSPPMACWPAPACLRAMRSATPCRAITAAAPATRRSSTRSRAWPGSVLLERKPTRPSRRRGHERAVQHTRQAELLYRPFGLAPQCQAAAGRARALRHRSRAAPHAARGLSAQPLCPCPHRLDRRGGSPGHARRKAGRDGRRSRAPLHALDRHARPFQGDEVGAAIALGRSRKWSGRGRPSWRSSPIRGPRPRMRPRL